MDINCFACFCATTFLFTHVPTFLSSTFIVGSFLMGFESLDLGGITFLSSFDFLSVGLVLALGSVLGFILIFFLSTISGFKDFWLQLLFPPIPFWLMLFFYP